MPKRPELDPEKQKNLYAKTESAPSPGKARRKRDPQNKVVSMGVGLRLSEWAELERIAAELGLNTPDTTGTHELSVWALRWFLREYQAGNIKPKTQTYTKNILE